MHRVASSAPGEFDRDAQLITCSRPLRESICSASDQSNRDNDSDQHTRVRIATFDQTDPPPSGQGSHNTRPEDLDPEPMTQAARSAARYKGPGSPNLTRKRATSTSSDSAHKSRVHFEGRARTNRVESNEVGDSTPSVIQMRTRSQFNTNEVSLAKERKPELPKTVQTNKRRAPVSAESPSPPSTKRPRAGNVHAVSPQSVAPLSQERPNHTLSSETSEDAHAHAGNWRQVLKRTSAESTLR